MIQDERTINQENDFRYESSASLRTITPSTQVGRLSGSHSDMGLLFTQFPGGRKVENRKVKRSARKVWFNLVFNCTRKKIGHSARLQVCCKSAAGKGLGVYHENNHGTNETAAGWTIGVGVLKAGTSVPHPELISSPCIASFVDGEAIQVSPSPALVERRPLGTEGLTHTGSRSRRRHMKRCFFLKKRRHAVGSCPL